MDSLFHDHEQARLSDKMDHSAVKYQSSIWEWLFSFGKLISTE